METEDFTTDIVIGLEIHAELDTKTKLFCSCSTEDGEPNSMCCPVCLGHPGSKPKTNKQAVMHSIKIASALHCTIAKQLIFSRKNYFYPDLAKNYQITQYEYPIGSEGYLELFDGKKIGIIRAHIEEDPASLVYPGKIETSKFVMIDYNRSGRPLCEIVTKPEIHSPKEARDFMNTLINILGLIKVFDPRKNIIKADANISIKESGYQRVEIKNISGFKDIERALNYEISRQKKVIEEGGKIILETRGFDAANGTTFTLRKKESENDYGYIFEPDLPPYLIEHELVSKIKNDIPTLPYNKYLMYVNSFKLNPEDAKVIALSIKLSHIFDEACKFANPVLVAKMIRKEIQSAATLKKIDTEDINIDPKEFAKALNMFEKGIINDLILQRIVERLLDGHFDVEEHVLKTGLAQISDDSELTRFCEEAIKENPNAITDYKSGKAEAANFLVGKVMQKSKGKANPKRTLELIKSIIENKN